MNAATSTLRIRRVGIDTWRENVAYLHRDCPVVRAAGFQALAKVTVQANGRSIARRAQRGRRRAASSARGAGPVGGRLPAWACRRATKPASTRPSRRLDRRAAPQDRRRTAVARRLHGHRARHRRHRYSKIELAAFVVATNQFELDRDEVLHLTEAMIASAQRIDWHDVGGGPVVDKHCIGGIPGNRTSMLVVPIVAAHGMLCPKTSSRAITSPAGTADTMEVLARSNCPRPPAADRARATAAAWPGAAPPTCRRPTTS
jgi:thymidine phosphorylase